MLEILRVSSDEGLSKEEVIRRQTEYGPNASRKSKERRLLVVFLSQFNNSIVYLLIVATAVSFFFRDYTEALAILIVILINAVIGFWMEAQAKRSMSALLKLDTVTAKVWRSGVLMEVPAEELVPGDILFIEAGDLVGADARLISIAQFEADESTMTGESVPVVKSTEVMTNDAVVADRKNMVYKGTVVTRGNARAVVTATGMDTELGKISALVESAKEEITPLHERLRKLSRKLIIMVLLIVITLLLVGLMEGRDIRFMIKTVIALAVASIPEGLPIVATIALARGMLKLAGHQVIVKKLAAVETLGSTNVIFTDKTGTLTHNRLEVNTICLPHHTLEINWNEKERSIRFQPIDPGHSDNENLKKLLTVAVLCNNAKFSDEDTVGDPLEVALLKIGEYHQRGFTRETYKIFTRIYEQPFDSDTKIMGTVHESSGKKTAAIKGAPEEILKHASLILQDGRVQPFDKGQKKEWLERGNDMAKNGLRVLAFAYQDEVTDVENFIHDAIFLGLAGFLDLPREEVPEAIRECHHAGIQVVMVTGDHPETAKNIALRIGLSNDPDETVVHGRELQSLKDLTPGEKERVLHARLFSRVSPAQKLQLVELYQDNGWIVGMTGDGVNDAPALKKSDIGIAMGRRGTQVAREAASMVLQDDSFASIVKAIEYGRTIYNNIKTFIVYLLSCNLSEILIVAFAAFINLPSPLLPLQILFLNIVTDVFPALALGMNEGRADVMNRPPRDPDEPMISVRTWKSIVSYSFCITVSVFGVFLYSHYFEAFSAQTTNNIAFLSLAFAQLLHPLNLASVKASFFLNEITSNPHLWAAVILCSVIIMVGYLVPPLNSVLSLETLSLKAWMLIAIGSSSHLLLIQVAKRTRLIR
jgi:Ca2+-transporting ATPase